MAPGPIPSRAVWLVVVAVFFGGLLMRVAGLDVRPDAALYATGEINHWHPTQAIPYLEIDERIYIALVEQLDAGKGYTLQGHPILQRPWMIRDQYDRPLFYHPPGGVALFWLAHRVFGESGFALVQVASFALFFWSLLLIGWLVFQPRATSADPSGPGLDRPGLAVALCALAVAGAGTPIMAHVANRLWLDAPLLAVSTAAAAVSLLSARRQSTGLAFAAGLLLGYASLVKLTAFLILPGVAALAWAVTPHGERRGLLRRGLLILAVAALVQLPWELWQWVVAGNAFPGWAGKPAAELVRTNSYVRYVTVIRSPWVYVTLLPRVLWTLVPSLALLLAVRRRRGIATRAAALLLWMAVVLGVHVGLGALGYAKLLRLVILVTPAAALLLALVVGGAADQLAREGRSRQRLGVAALLLLAIAGLCAEVAQGAKTTFHDDGGSDVIIPLTGLPR